MWRCSKEKWSSSRFCQAHAIRERQRIQRDMERKRERAAQSLERKEKERAVHKDTHSVALRIWMELSAGEELS